MRCFGFSSACDKSLWYGGIPHPFTSAGIWGPEIGIKNLKIIFKFLRLNTGLHRLNIARTRRIKVFPVGYSSCNFSLVTRNFRVLNSNSSSERLRT